GSDVIVVPHSYGGIPVSSAIRSLDSTSRADAGRKIGVIAAISSFVLPEGVNLTDAEQRPRSDLDALPAVLNWPSAEMFHHDIIPEEIKKWEDPLKPVAAAALFDPCRFSAYEVVLVHYLLATKDRAIPLETQHHILEVFRPKAMSIRTEEVDSDHSPF